MRIGVRRFIGRRVLNHKQLGVDGIYDLHDYFDQKLKALRRWTNHVIRLHTSASIQPTPTASNAGSPPVLLNNREIAGHWVKHSLTRAQLHELVWSTPIRILCKEFAVSNVWLAKICVRYEIPVPGRGYWAKKRSGVAVAVLPLEPATQGIAEVINIRGGASSRRRKLSDPQVGSDTLQGLTEP